MSLSSGTRNLSSRFLLCLAMTAVGGYPFTATGQLVESPVLPRGSILFEVRTANTQASRIHDGDGGSRGFALGLMDPELVPPTFPALVPEQERLRELLGDPGGTLSMGTLQGRFDVDEQSTPIRIGWGAADRITVGVTVPIVRRRVFSFLGVDPEGGNVGMNPSEGSTANGVSAFRSEAAIALANLQGTVAAVCEQEGQESASCQQGQAALDRVSGFVDTLDSAFDEALLFPLAGSVAGSTLRDRWDAARTDLAAWGAGGPETLPLATRAISAADFESRFVQPVWGGGGFPTESSEALAELGDVQLHLVVGLIQGDEINDGSRVRLRSAVEFSARLPTGVPDSLALLTPMEPPRGYAGGGIRWISDVGFEERFAILSEVEWETFTSRDLVLLGTDRMNPWDAEMARRSMEGAPGDRVRVSLAPRFIITRGLSLGIGWEWRRGGVGLWTPTAAVGPEVKLEDTRQQRASVEFRFAGWDASLREGMPFPVEIVSRASWSFSGSEGAPKDRRIELGVRLLRGAP
jgi:hypothetical protein